MPHAILQCEGCVVRFSVLCVFLQKGMFVVFAICTMCISGGYSGVSVCFCSLFCRGFVVLGGVRDVMWLWVQLGVSGGKSGECGVRVCACAMVGRVWACGWEGYWLSGAVV